jgi:hypothetical protein
MLTLILSQALRPREALIFVTGMTLARLNCANLPARDLRIGEVIVRLENAKPPLYTLVKWQTILKKRTLACPLPPLPV